MVNTTRPSKARRRLSWKKGGGMCQYYCLFWCSWSKRDAVMRQSSCFFVRKVEVVRASPVSVAVSL